MPGDRTYELEDHRDPAAELERLRRQAELVAVAEERAYAALGLPERGRCLDIGCGPGFVARRTGHARPDVRLVGLDRDRPALARVAAGVPVLQADAVHLPFAAGAFDAALARLVLRHVPAPERVLAEAARVLRPGGVMLAADADDGALLVDPEPDGLARALAARQETFRRRGCDRFIGRRLVGLLRRAGFRDVRARALTIASDEVGPEAFAAIVLAPLAAGVDDDLAGPGEVAGWAEAFRRWGARADVFGVTTAVVAAGRKP